MNTIRDVRAKAMELLFTQFTVSARGKTITTSARDLGYSFAYDNALARFGYCNYRKRTISLSKHYVHNNVGKHNADIIDTILHEIAHTISFEIFKHRGHGITWQLVAKQVGANPEACGDGSIKIADHKYTLVCGNCGRESKKHRLRKHQTYACGKCCREYNGGRYTDAYVMEVIQNH